MFVEVREHARHVRVEGPYGLDRGLFEARGSTADTGEGVGDLLRRQRVGARLTLRPGARSTAAAATTPMSWTQTSCIGSSRRTASRTTRVPLTSTGRLKVSKLSIKDTGRR